MTKKEIALLFLIAVTGLTGFASFAAATSFVIPEGTVPVACAVTAEVTKAQDAGYQMQKLSLKITESEFLDEQSGEVDGDAYRLACKASEVNSVNDVKYLYSSCDDKGKCVAVAGGDGPKLAKGDAVEGTLVLMVYANGSAIEPRFEYSQATGTDGEPTDGNPQDPSNPPADGDLPPLPDNTESKRIISIQRGWNLVSTAFDNGFYKVAENSCNPQAQNAWVYKNNKYEKIRVQDMAPSYAYWIYSTQPCEITLKRDTRAVTVIREYEKGWNAIDYAFQEKGKECTITRGKFAWDAVEQEWVLVSHLEYGKGYFVKVSEDCGKTGVIKEAEIEWLEYAPKQCKSNPWDEWYATGEVKYVQEPDEETLVRDWLSNEYGIEVQGYAVRGNEDAAVCLACSCPRGDTLRVMVYEEDASKMLELGFKKS